MFQPCFSNQLWDELRGNGKPPVYARENVFELCHTLGAFCNFSIITISLKRFHEQMLYRYRSKVPQLIDATEREN